MRILPVAVVLVALTGCSSGGGGSGGSSPPAARIAVHGTVLLHDLLAARGAATDGANKTTPGCKGEGAYADVLPGGDVVIADDAGRTLTIAKLTGGFVIDDDATTCSFTFAASAPSGPSFYTVTVGRQAPVKESRAVMVKGPTLTIGA